MSGATVSVLLKYERGAFCAMRACARDVVDDGTPHKFRDVMPFLFFFPPLLF